MINRSLQRYKGIDLKNTSRDRLKMKLLNNAIKSIQLGVEDFEKGDEKRIISSVRNLYSGILLLFKEKLARLSPNNSNEVLIKTKIAPQKQKDGSIIFVGFGRKTVNRHQIQERFQHLHINVEWKRVDRIANIRNDLEHYYSKENKDTIREALSKTFLIVRDFITEELKEDPLKLLGNNCWNKLLIISEVFEKEKAECIKALSNINWQSGSLNSATEEIECDACGSSLVVPYKNISGSIEDVEFICRSCGCSINFIDVAVNCLEKYFEFDNYLVFDDGNDPALVECPECFHNAYVVEEERCAICGYERENEFCDRCGARLKLDDQSSAGICSHCDYIMSKED